jgi:integrase
VAPMNKKHLLNQPENLEIEAETQILELTNGSNPSLSAKLTAFPREFDRFFDPLNQVWQQVADKYPYKLARLIHHDYDLTKRWYVLFYAYNVSTEKLERKRIFEPINRKKTVTSRLNIANDIIAQINADLRSGKVLGKEKIKTISTTAKLQLEKFTLLQAIDFFIERQIKNKKRKNYTKRFETLKTHLNEFYSINQLEDINIRQVDEDFLEPFFDFVREKCKSNKTFNNYRDDFSIFINYLINVRPTKPIFKDNPVKSIPKLRVVNRKHAAYNSGQLKSIIDKAKELGFNSFVLYIQFMFYTLARPIEVLSIRIADIDLENDRILIHGEDSKNWRDEFVRISPRFKEIIIQSGIMDLPLSYFVFSNNDGLAGAEPYKTTSPAWKKMDVVLKALGYKLINEHFSLYSIKHSGAIELYLQTKDIIAVKNQCRHTSIEQTDKYLRDLGVVRTDNPLDKWEGSI